MAPGSLAEAEDLGEPAEEAALALALEGHADALLLLEEDPGELTTCSPAEETGPRSKIISLAVSRAAIRAQVAP